MTAGSPLAAPSAEPGSGGCGCPGCRPGQPVARLLAAVHDGERLCPAGLAALVRSGSLARFVLASAGPLDRPAVRALSADGLSRVRRALAAHPAASFGDDLGARFCVEHRLAELLEAAGQSGLDPVATAVFLVSWEGPVSAGFAAASALGLTAAQPPDPGRAARAGGR